jgi:predicted TIM-barrel fold metal-dependent hydrolase
VLLKALDELEGRGRGVAVVDPTSAGSDLGAMKARGVSGLPVNIYSPAAQNVGGGSDDLDAVTVLAADNGMHVEVNAPLPLLLQHADAIRDSGVPPVIDHYGLYGSARPSSPEGRALLSLLERDYVWMKLSSPYRRADRPLNVEPDREWLQACLSTAPNRCVWGSDWPHPPPHEQHGGPDATVPWRPISYGALFEQFVQAVGDPDLAERLLGDNPFRLYGFDADTG